MLICFFLTVYFWLWILQIVQLANMWLKWRYSPFLDISPWSTHRSNPVYILGSHWPYFLHKSSNIQYRYYGKRNQNSHLIIITPPIIISLRAEQLVLLSGSLTAEFWQVQRFLFSSPSAFVFSLRGGLIGRVQTDLSLERFHFNSSSLQEIIILCFLKLSSFMV